MTFKEKLIMDHPNLDSEEIDSIIDGLCPSDYDYESGVQIHKCLYDKDLSCRDCWNREILETQNKNEENKESNTMPTKVIKTKTELLEELEAANKQVAVLEEEIKDLEKYKAYEEMADEMFAIRKAFVKSGFSEDEAFQLLMYFINKADAMSKPVMVCKR